MAPAFTGLGAPCGTRTRAALDSVCFRIGDPVAAMRADGAAVEARQRAGARRRDRRRAGAGARRALGAALGGRVDCRDGATVVVLSGGNVDPQCFREALAVDDLR